MVWIHTGGGYYDNEETGERIRGKANLPAEAFQPPEASQPSGTSLPCMTCHRVTVHTERPTHGDEVWAFYTCSECNGKTKVRLN